MYSVTGEIGVEVWVQLTDGSDVPIELYAPFVGDWLSGRDVTVVCSWSDEELYGYVNELLMALSVNTADDFRNQIELQLNAAVSESPWDYHQETLDDYPVREERPRGGPTRTVKPSEFWDR